MATAAAEDGAQDTAFQNISLGGKNVVTMGVFKMGPAGIGWRGKNGQTTKVVASDVQSAAWIRIGLPYQLKLEAKGGASYKFDGFREADFAAIRKYVVDAYNVPLKEAQVSHKGWNWGQANVENATLKFSIDTQPSFELPLTEATAANVNKTDVSVSFNPTELATEEGDALAEIKFFVPNTRAEPEPKLNENGEEEEIPEYNEELMHTPAEVLADKIYDHIEVLPANAQPIVVFERISMSTPRGQVDLQLHPTFFFLAGKNFRVDYTHVVRIFLLPQLQAEMSSFVLALDPPIRQGSTSYPLIVFSVPTKEIESVKLNQVGLPEKSRATTLGSELGGALDSIVARVFGTLADKKVTVPGAAFKSARDEASCVPCNYKAADGFLYPLENSFICIVPKSPVHIPFADIAYVHFKQVSQLINVTVNLKTGATHTFMLIPIIEFQGMYAFCKSKHIKLEGDEPASAEPKEGSRRARTQRTSALASRSATKREIAHGGGDDDDDDDDEDDGEFQAGDEEDDSVSEDEDADAEEEEEEKPKKKAKARSVPGESDAAAGPKKVKKSGDDDE